MSGRRCKALRKQFIQAHGRAPYKTQRPSQKWWDPGMVLQSSEWRRLKKDWRAA